MQRKRSGVISRLQVFQAGANDATKGSQTGELICDEKCFVLGMLNLM